MSSLKKFDYRIKDNRKRNIFLYGIVLVVVTIIGVKLYQSKAQFTSTTNELNLANGKVRLTCTDKVKPGYNRNLTEYVKKLYDSDVCPELVDDETIDNNLRYIGATPDNYVWFNDELWRIIGVMNNIIGGSSSNGEGETRIKLIRKDFLQPNDSDISFDWDYKQNGVGSSINDNGSNDWTDSQLMMMLNPIDIIKKDWENQDSKSNYIISSDNEKIATDGTTTFYKGVGSYFERKLGYKPAQVSSRETFSGTEINFSETGLQSELKNLIDKAEYNLGAVTYSNTSTAMYIEERSDTPATTGRPTTWTGYIGLMYPSDYGYATSGGNKEEEKKDRDECLDYSMNNWNSSNLECRDNDWLYDSSHTQWTISPRLSNAYFAIAVSNLGYIGSNEVNNARTVRPVLYLKSNVKITSGNGSKENPFKLSL